MEELLLTKKILNWYDLNKRPLPWRKNVSFSQPKNISAVFFPVLYVNDEIQNFNENFFYMKWMEVEIKNKLINFVLPIEDLVDLSKITEMKDRIEQLNVNDLVNKYNEKNYVLTFME